VAVFVVIVAKLWNLPPAMGKMENEYRAELINVMI
jgi:hypothetical protein